MRNIIFSMMILVASAAMACDEGQQTASQCSAPMQTQTPIQTRRETLQPRTQPQLLQQEDFDPEPSSPIKTSYNINFNEPVRTIEYITIQNVNGQILRNVPVLNGYMPQVRGGNTLSYNRKIQFDRYYRAMIAKTGYLSYIPAAQAALVAHRD